MQFRFLAVCFFFLNTIASAAPAPESIPGPLLDQVERLTELLRDSYAVGYPEGTMFKIVKPAKGEQLSLAVFTVEGFGGGNNHTQYFAAFNYDTDEEGKRPHFTFIDVIPIAGKGWRGIMNLNAKVVRNSKTYETEIFIPAQDVGPDDAPNFPSKKTTIRLLLKDGRLAEVKKP